LLNSSFEQLKIEDELENHYASYALCADLVTLYGEGDVEPLIVDLFTNEIVLKGKEAEFEEFMRKSLFTLDDLRFTNRIKEIIYQRKIEDFDEQI
jgi:hypothetical protein